MNEKMELGDVVISLSSKDGLLSSLGCRIYVKDGRSHRQIGLMQRFRMDAQSDKYLIKADAVMTPMVPGLTAAGKDAIRRNVKMLSKFKNLNVSFAKMPVVRKRRTRATA